jgi:hypothetical protein
MDREVKTLVSYSEVRLLSEQAKLMKKEQQPHLIHYKTSSLTAVLSLLPV